MRNVRLLLPLLCVGLASCYLGVSGGLYSVPEESGSRTAWSIGLTAGYYVNYGDTRLSAARSVEASLPRHGPVQHYSGMIWTAQVDHSLTENLRLTALGGTGPSAIFKLREEDVVTLEGGSTHFGYLGVSPYFDGFMMSAGPAVMRFSAPETGTVNSMGGQVRLMFSYSPSDLAEMISESVTSSGECGRWCMALRHTASQPVSKPIPREEREFCHMERRCDATHGSCRYVRRCFRG
jgi:hypothetical protein